MSNRRLPLLLLFLLAFSSGAFAHRLDEYLQAALVAIEPGGVRLHLDLTPGVAVAEKVIVLIDRDRDGSISASEAAGYAERLQRDLLVRLDQQEVALTLVASRFPTPAELRTGSGIIRVIFTLGHNFPAGEHRLTLENRHLPAISVHLFNAARPGSTAVRVVEQTRNTSQSANAITFTLAASSAASGASEPEAGSR